MGGAKIRDRTNCRQRSGSARSPTVSVPGIGPGHDVVQFPWQHRLALACQEALLDHLSLSRSSSWRTWRSCITTSGQRPARPIPRIAKATCTSSKCTRRGCAVGAYAGTGGASRASYFSLESRLQGNALA